MIRDIINGFCMALADSVPGVSGGTVAFIMKFYDKFISAINDLAFGKKEDKKLAFKYLIKLGIGWVIGMSSAVLVLTSLFERNIYFISSMFIGFIIGAIPIIINEEIKVIKNWRKGILFCILGMVIVLMITYLNTFSSKSLIDLKEFSIVLAIKLFIIGMISITAMFLPGISGSTLLLIFGAYIPVMTALKNVISLNLEYLPALLFFIMGIVTGALSIVKGIKICLDRFRTQSVYFIVGMMIGSFYAIIMGPTTLHNPQHHLTFGTFNIIAAAIGIALILILQLVKKVES